MCSHSIPVANVNTVHVESLHPVPLPSPFDVKDGAGSRHRTNLMYVVLYEGSVAVLQCCVNVHLLMLYVCLVFTDISNLNVECFLVHWQACAAIKPLDC